MADEFGRYDDTVATPARKAFTVTPHDSNDIDPLPKALIAGSTGTIVLRAVDSASDVSIPVVAGQVLPIRAQYVRSTGTGVTNITALA